MDQAEGVSVRSLARAVAFLAILYLFFVSIELMGSTFKLFGTGFAQSLLETTAHPITGLFIGIFVTSVIQSSSTTTSIVVGLVAGNALSIDNAILIVMGANIGTSVTNALVSLGHITRRNEFRLAVTGATVHDFFNLCTVIVLLPLELYTGYLHKISALFEKLFEGVGGLKLVSPLKVIVKPVVEFIHSILMKDLGVSPVPAGVIMLVLALALLFFALKNIVTIMKQAVIGRVEHMIHSVLFQSPLRSFLLGLALTATVQSSSITTSLIVPMIGAGILSVAQFYPYTLGANVGTTVTAIMASFATGNPAGVTVAFVHLFFNISGCAIFYPLRIVPITLATTLGNIAGKYRVAGIAFVVIMFFVIPLTLIFITR